MQPGPFRLRCRGERRAEQDDAKIGIGAGHCKSCLDGVEDACADARSRGRQWRSGCLGADGEVGRGHAMAGGEDMNVAGFRRIELG